MMHVATLGAPSGPFEYIETPRFKRHRFIPHSAPAPWWYPFEIQQRGMGFADAASPWPNWQVGLLVVGVLGAAYWAVHHWAHR